MYSKKDAEDEIVKEALDQFAERVKEEDYKINIITPCKDIDEIRKKIERAAALSSNSQLRIGVRFLKESEQK